MFDRPLGGRSTVQIFPVNNNHCRNWIQTEIILTNNSKVNDKYKSKFEIEFIEKSGYLNILYEARNMIYQGYRLLTHPMSSSLKPNQTKFRSIILQKNQNNLDTESILMIERAIESAEKFLKFKKTPDWDEKILDDFRTVDMSIIEGVLNRISFFIN